MTTIKKLITLLPVFFLAACAQVSFFAVNLPVHPKKENFISDVSFGPDDWQKLDIYLPENASDKKSDVVVFIYGGRWSTGKKELYKFVGQALADKGFIVVIPDFRKYPEVKFPLFIEDTAQSLAWVENNIGSYGGDLNKMHLMGHSSGAHVGALLSADPHYLKALNKDRSIIRSFVGLSGPYAFTPDEPDLIDMFGPPERYPQMQVPTFIDGHQPPMFLVYGGKDKVVGQFNMDKLAQKIQEKGGCVTTKIYPELSHTWTIGAFSWIGKNKAPVLDDVADYFYAADGKDFCDKK